MTVFVSFIIKIMRNTLKEYTKNSQSQIWREFICCNIWNSIRNYDFFWISTIRYILCWADGKNRIGYQNNFYSQDFMNVWKMFTVASSYFSEWMENYECRKRWLSDFNVFFDVIHKNFYWTFLELRRVAFVFLNLCERREYFMGRIN